MGWPSARLLPTATPLRPRSNAAAEVLNSMAVTMDNFKTALGLSNPSALRETVVEVRAPSQPAAAPPTAPASQGAAAAAAAATVCAAAAAAAAAEPVPSPQSLVLSLPCAGAQHQLGGHRRPGERQARAAGDRAGGWGTCSRAFQLQAAQQAGRGRWQSNTAAHARLLSLPRAALAAFQHPEVCFAAPHAVLTSPTMCPPLQYPVEHPEKFEKYGMAPSKGVLFYGPPGESWCAGRSRPWRGCTVHMHVQRSREAGRAGQGRGAACAAAWPTGGAAVTPPAPPHNTDCPRAPLPAGCGKTLLAKAIANECQVRAGGRAAALHRGSTPGGACGIPLGAARAQQQLPCPLAHSTPHPHTPPPAGQLYFGQGTRAADHVVWGVRGKRARDL